VPEVIKCVSHFVLIFIKREKFQKYIPGIFFCSFTNTANRYVSAPQARQRPAVPQGAEIQEDELDPDIYLGFQP
jgi:hypothetical protein